MTDAPLPDLILYGRPDCELCVEARGMLDALLADRRGRGLATPRVVERNIDTDPDWQRALFAVVPVVEFGERRLETVTSLATLRRFLAEQLDAPTDHPR